MASMTDLRRMTNVYCGEVFADCLRQHGFVSRGGDNLSWFRLTDHQVVHSICFFTRHTSLPVILEIGFGFHPLFIQPTFKKGPYQYEIPGTELMFGQFQILKQSNRIYAPDIMILCPADDHMGVDILNRIFPILDVMQTPLECYEAHKTSRLEQIENNQWFSATTQFVDEVLYWNDSQLYPFCCEYINGMIAYLECVQQGGRRLRKNDQDLLVRLRHLQSIMIDGRRGEHLDCLRKAEIQTLALLYKHTGINNVAE